MPKNNCFRCNIINNTCVKCLKEKSKQKGGKFLGSGTYGCVFYPHLKCKDVNNIKDGIGKVFPLSEDFEEELLVTKLIQKKSDPKNEFTIPILNSCNIHYVRDTDQFNKCTIIKQNTPITDLKQIIYKNAGKSLQDVLENKTPLKGSPSTFLRIFQSLGPLIKGLTRFNEVQFVHCDIKPGNIMIKSNKINLIDFGITCYEEDVYTKERIAILTANYLWYPPEFKAFLYKNNNDFERLFKRVLDNYDKYIIRAFYNILHMDIAKDFQAFFRADPPKKDYKTQYASKVDVFSLGIVILELLIWSEYNNQIYRNNSQKAIIRQMIISMIKSMVQFDPRRRASMLDVYSQYSDIIKLIKCMKRPVNELKLSPSLRDVNPKTKVNMCIAELTQ
jgi:serine/threonine protein kinase